MNELIKVTQHTTLINAVNARDLHLYLEIGKDYSTWIKVQIERADLIQDVDYVVLTQKGEAKIEYFLTIEAGKNIAMLSQSQKGKEVRAYFIECEKQLKEVSSMPSIANPQIAAMMLALQAVDRLEQEQASQKQLLIEQQSQINDIKAKAISSPQDYFTVAGYASLRGVNVDVKAAAAMGRKAVKLSKELDLPIHKTHSEVFGAVNTYHVDCLCILFGERDSV